jgi:hypothetical protein
MERAIHDAVLVVWMWVVLNQWLIGVYCSVTSSPALFEDIMSRTPVRALQSNVRTSY